MGLTNLSQRISGYNTNQNEKDKTYSYNILSISALSFFTSVSSFLFFTTVSSKSILVSIDSFRNRYRSSSVLLKKLSSVMMIGIPMDFSFLR